MTCDNDFGFAEITRNVTEGNPFVATHPPNSKASLKFLACLY